MKFYEPNIDLDHCIYNPRILQWSGIYLHRAKSTDVRDDICWWQVCDIVNIIKR